MSTETHTLSKVKKTSGHFPPLFETPVTVVSGQNLVALEIVASDVNGKIITHPGFTSTSKTFVTASGSPDTTDGITVNTTPRVAGVMVHAVDASGGDKPGNLYESGCFFASVLTWPAGASTDILKRKLLENSLIKVTFQTTGEV